MDLKKLKIKLKSKEALWVEEIFLDAQIKKKQLLSELQETQFERPLRDSALFLILILMVGAILFSLGRAFHLQKQNKAFLAEVMQNKSRVFPILPPRGIIYDRNLKVLATNKPSFDVIFLPQFLPSSESARQEVLNDLIKILGDFGIEEKIENVLAEQILDPVVIATNIDPVTKLKLNNAFGKKPIVRVVENSLRQYLYGDYLSHIIGYTGLPSVEEVAQGLLPSLRIGKTGIESFYNDLLTGQVGYWRIDLDSLGNFQDQKLIRQAQPGKSLILTINIELQKKLTDFLRQQLLKGGGKSAAAVALNPQNGEILALVSLPSFDNNDFIKGLDFEEFQTLVNNPAKPLFNRAVSGLYSPGSAIKPFIAIAALREKIVTPKTIIDASEGKLVLTNPYTGQKEVFLDWRKHGLINIFDAIAFSSNVYFYTIGGGYGDIEGLGPELIKKYEARFGLGKFLDIDLPGEKKDLLPDPAWKKKFRASDPVWRRGDTYHISIGQGDILVVPLHLVNAYAAIANGGKVMRPFIVKGVVDSSNYELVETLNRAEILADNPDLFEEIDVVKEAMRQTITRGTARSLSQLPVSAAGKTGTAQVGLAQRTNSWFVAFAPYENPKMVLGVVIEGSRFGAAESVTVVRQTFNWYFGDYLLKNQQNNNLSSVKN